MTKAISFNFKKRYILSFICCLTCFISCSKTTGETAAKRISGTYKGSMTTSSGTYSYYVIKIEQSSKDEIKVSCISSPKAYESTVFSVMLANNTIMDYYYDNIDLWNQNSSPMINLSINGNSFVGARQ